MSTPSSPPPSSSWQIPPSAEPIIEQGLITTGVGIVVGGLLGTLLTRRGSGWRLGAVVAGAGFGVGSTLERTYATVKGKE